MKETLGVPGLPDVYSIDKRKAGNAFRYIPKLRGNAFTLAGGRHGIAWYPSYEQAVKMLHEFVGRMQS